MFRSTTVMALGLAMLTVVAMPTFGDGLNVVVKGPITDDVLITLSTYRKVCDVLPQVGAAPLQGCCLGGNALAA